MSAIMLRCASCGSSFDFSRSPGTRGRNPATCSPDCRIAHKRAWNKQNGWKYQIETASTKTKNS